MNGEFCIKLCWSLGSVLVLEFTGEETVFAHALRDESAFRKNEALSERSKFRENSLDYRGFLPISCCREAA